MHVFLGRWTIEVIISESVSKKCFNHKSTETQNRQKTAKWVRMNLYLKPQATRKHRNRERKTAFYNHLRADCFRQDCQRELESLMKVWWERGCILSLEVSPQRLYVTYSKEKVVAAGEESRGQSSTSPSKWTSPLPRQVGASRAGRQERHNLMVRVCRPAEHTSDLNIRESQANPKPQLYDSKRSESQKTKK